ncbi:MAG: hypothetical protein R3F43_12650 [bacterium]
MLSSGAHRMASRGIELDNLSGETDYDDWRMYGRSKLANILFARSLAKRFAGTARTATAVHPRHRDEPGAAHRGARRDVRAAAADDEDAGPGGATRCWAAVRPGWPG